MKDSTIHEAHVLGQASSIEKVDNENHYNQVSSKYMLAFFVKGEISRSDAVGSVQTIYYPIDEKDSTFHGLNYLETDTMKMYIEQRKLQKIWTNKAKGTWLFSGFEGGTVEMMVDLNQNKVKFTVK